MSRLQAAGLLPALLCVPVPLGAAELAASTSIIQKVTYQPGQIAYRTFEPSGREILRITFAPRSVLADGKELPARDWTYRGVPVVLRIQRAGARNIVINQFSSAS